MATVSNNPTRTIGIEKRWKINFNKRYATLRKRVKVRLAQTADITSAEFVKEFNTWFGLQIDELLIERSTAETIWQNTFLNEAFGKGIKTSTTALARKGIIVPAISAENLDSIRLVREKSFEDLKGIVAATKAEVARNLATGVENGANKLGLFKTISDRINKIGRTRSRTLVGTRTAETYDTGVVQQAEAAQSLTDEEVFCLWVTRGDELVRTTHALRNRKLFTPKVARRLIGEPNCRCGLKIQIGRGTSEQARIRDIVRRRELARSAQARQERVLFESIGPRSGISEFGQADS